MKAYREALAEFQRNYFSKLLAVTDHNVTDAAHLAGLNRTAIYVQIRRCGIKIKAQQGRPCRLKTKAA